MDEKLLKIYEGSHTHEMMRNVNENFKGKVDNELIKQFNGTIFTVFSEAYDIGYVEGHEECRKHLIECLQIALGTQLEKNK